MNEVDLAKIEVWFEYHPPTDDQRRAYEVLRAKAKELAECIVESCPPGADRTAALRKVREAVMTANAAIACNGT